MGRRYARPDAHRRRNEPGIVGGRWENPAMSTPGSSEGVSWIDVAASAAGIRARGFVKPLNAAARLDNEENATLLKAIASVGPTERGDPRRRRTTPLRAISAGWANRRNTSPIPNLRPKRPARPQRAPRAAANRPSGPQPFLHTTGLADLGANLPAHRAALRLP